MKNKIITLFLGAISVSIPVVTLVSCNKANSNSPVELVTKNLTGDKIITIKLDEDTIPTLKQKWADIQARKNTKGEHFAVILVTDSSEASIVYAVKNDSEGFDENAESNLLPYAEKNKNGYDGYMHQINGEAWVHQMLYYTLLARLEKEVAKTDDGLTIVKFDSTNINLIDLDNTSQKEAIDFLDLINLKKVTMGAHTAFRIKEGTIISTLVYAIKNEEEGFADSKNGNYLLELSDTGYEGYFHEIDGVEWTHDFAYYDLLNKVKNIAYPKQVITIPENEVKSIDLSTSTKDEAIAFIDLINTAKQANGKHSAFSITSATTTSSTAVMVYAVKNDDEGYSSTAENNLLPFQGAGYTNIVHKIGTSIWTYDSKYSELYKELLIKAGVVIELKDKVINGDNLIEVNLDNASPAQAKLALHRVEVAGLSEGVHVALKLTKNNQSSIMVYATKSTMEGFDSSMNAAANRLPFEGHGYAGYNHLIENVAWTHDQSFYGLIGSLRSLASQHTGNLDFPLLDSEIIKVNLNGLTKEQAIEYVTLKDKWNKIPGKHFALQITSVDGTSTIAMVYAVKTITEGYDKTAASNLLSYDMATYDYQGYNHSIDEVNWRMNSAFHGLNKVLNDKAKEV